MSKFKLLPCKVLAQSFVSNGDEAIECDFKGLLSLVGVETDPALMNKIKAIKPGCFIGKSTVNKNMVNFLLFNPDRGNSFDWVEDKDPTFGSRVVSVYKVEAANWGGSTKELSI